MRTRFRKPLLYPLSYGGASNRVTLHPGSSRGRAWPGRRKGQRRDPTRLGSRVKTNWFIAAIAVGIGAIVIAAVAMLLS